ncbi:MAG TPA: type IV pilus assembly protein PilM [Candidatus Moranbacteria bacterium]|nr:type IV pilus assembly protein PilM [Candidatus Moranbacteria bacterium]
MAIWNKKIINLKSGYFSLDISDLSVKVFQLEKNGALDSIRSFGVKEIPLGCIENGKIINREKVIEIIKNLLQTSGPKKINTKKVICSLPESKVFLRTVAIPEMNEGEATEAVKWEIEASIPLSVEQVYYDWQFLDKIEGKQNVLTAAVAKEFVDELMGVLKDCELEVYGLEMESIASIRSLISKDAKPEEVFLIVDIGSNKTSFTVCEGTTPYFTSSIPFSSSGITDEISSRMNLAKEEAQNLKFSQGIENSSGNNSVLNSIAPLLENLSTEIEKTIDFYQNMPKTKAEIGKIILIGGGANLKGLLTYLKSKLSKEIFLGDPWINLNFGKKIPDISQADSARYAVSAGLAMRGTNYGNKN